MLDPDRQHQGVLSTAGRTDYQPSTLGHGPVPSYSQRGYSRVQDLGTGKLTTLKTQHSLCADLWKEEAQPRDSETKYKVRIELGK